MASSKSKVAVLALAFLAVLVGLYFLWPILSPLAPEQEVDLGLDDDPPESYPPFDQIRLGMREDEVNRLMGHWDSQTSSLQVPPGVDTQKFLAAHEHDPRYHTSGWEVGQVYYGVEFDQHGVVINKTRQGPQRGRHRSPGGRRGKEPVPELVPRAWGENLVERARATERLLNVLATTDDEVEYEKCCQFFLTSRPDDGRALRIMVNDLFGADADREITASFALHRVGPPGIAVLVRAYESPDYHTRAEVVRWLGAIRPTTPAGVELLALALRDRHVLVRVRAARALGQLGPAAAAAGPALPRALEDHEAYEPGGASDEIGVPVSKFAAEAIEKITQPGAPAPRGGPAGD